MKNISSPQAGLSLIEMAIVLVIIAVLAGGILKGRTLITQGAMRKMATQIESLQAAVDTYTSSYGELPSTEGKGVRVWDALYKAQLIGKPDSTGFPKTALGGHFYVLKKACEEKTGAWLAIGSGEGEHIRPLLSGAQLSVLRHALGYEAGDPNFVTEGEGCAEAVSTKSQKKCVVLIFLCE